MNASQSPARTAGPAGTSQALLFASVPRASWGSSVRKVGSVPSRALLAPLSLGLGDIAGTCTKANGWELSRGWHLVSATTEGAHSGSLPCRGRCQPWCLLWFVSPSSRAKTVSFSYGSALQGAWAAVAFNRQSWLLWLFTWGFSWGRGCLCWPWARWGPGVLSPRRVFHCLHALTSRSGRLRVWPVPKRRGVRRLPRLLPVCVPGGFLRLPLRDR